MTAIQRCQQHRLRRFRRVHFQVARGAHREAEVFRMNFVFGDFSVLQFADQRARAERNFVERITTMHDHHMLRAETLHHAHLNTHQVSVKYTHHGVRCAGRIGQRAENIEDGFDAELTADRSDRLHREMVVRREHEADARGLNALCDLAGNEHDVHTERFQHIGRAAL